jgi:hypothetical protein
VGGITERPPRLFKKLVHSPIVDVVGVIQQVEFTKMFGYIADAHVRVIREAARKLTADALGHWYSFSQTTDRCMCKEATNGTSHDTQAGNVIS